MLKTSVLYDARNEEKKNIDQQGKIKRVLKGEIRIAKVGVNIGSEISKDHPFQRPVLVLAEKIGGDLVYIVPLTSKYNENFAAYLIPFEDRERHGLKEMSYFVINQIKPLSIKRLVKKINNLTIDESTIPKVSHDVLQTVKTGFISLM